MQITTELLDTEIAGMTRQLEQKQAELHVTSGALQVLKQLRAKMDDPEPAAEAPSVDPQ